MKTYTVTLTSSIEAESEEEAIQIFANSTLDELNTGENIESEIEEDL